MIDDQALRDRAPRATFATGTLTRFFPIVIAEHEGATPRLAMVDIEQGAILWQAPTQTTASVFRFENRWYWTWLADGPRLVVFDGDTGRMEHAIHVKAPEVMPITPSNVAGGSMWLVSAHSVKAPALPVACLDARTLQVVAGAEEFVVVDMMGDPVLREIPRR